MTCMLCSDEPVPDSTDEPVPASTDEPVPASTDEPAPDSTAEPMPAPPGGGIECSSAVLSRLLAFAGHVALRQLIHLDGDTFGEMTRRNAVQEASMCKGQQSSAKEKGKVRRWQQEIFTGTSNGGSLWF